MLNNIQPVRNIKRWREVQTILFRYGFDFFISNKEIRNIQSTLNQKLHIKLALPESELKKLNMPQRVRLMLQDLGPTFVKLGQILASRSDLLPGDWIAELSKLQDDVPAFSFEEVQQIIEEDLGPIEELFLDFDPEPIAAASIGQVHNAILPNFKAVVVKVQRPNIIPRVQSDMEIVREIARLLRSRTDWGKKYGVMAMVDEMSRVLSEEMNYQYEATNADRLRRNMEPMQKVHVPRMYWDMITPRVLTMEAIEGVKINNLAALDENGVDRTELAHIFIKSIFKQLLVDGFFHADPHPANIFVNLEKHSLVFIDTGMMGSLLPEQREQLGGVVQAILQRDTMEIHRLALTLGTPFQPVNETKLRRDMDRIIHQYLEAPLERISFSNLVSQVLTTIFQNGIRLPAELGWAAKTLLQGEEVGRTLDPDIVVVDILQSIAMQVLWKRLDPRTIASNTTTSMRQVGSLIQIMPRALTSILKQLDSGTFRVGIDIIDLREVIGRILILSNRLIAGLILAGMLIGSATAMTVDLENSWPVIPILGIIAFIISMVIATLMVWTVFSDIWRTQRKRKKEARESEQIEN
jgi:ubiquinone biosynthesis protein